MSEDMIIIYGTDWCWDCRRTRRFFENHGIPYQWINIDQDRDGERFVLETNRGNRSVPTILLPGGAVLVEPSNRELDQQFPQGQEVLP